jgi:hypothetical protein
MATLDGVPSVPQAAAPAARAFDVVSPAVDGAVALTEVLRAFNVHAGDLAACVDRGGGHVPAELGLALVVDRTGDTFRTRVSPPATPGVVARCIEAVTEAFAFTPPPSPAQITLTLRIRDAAASPPRK